MGREHEIMRHVPQPIRSGRGDALICVCGRWLWWDYEQQRYEHAA